MSAFVERLPEPAARVARLARRLSHVVMFAAGFLFDFLTMQRIDAWTDLAIQFLYLVCLTSLLILQHRESLAVWTPPAFVRQAWSYKLDVLHFLYGGLLSAYVVLYFRSSTGARPLLFFCVLIALMFFNEMPEIRRVRHRLRLGLYAFCVVSFLNYFVPILIGQMGGWVFLLSLLLSGAVVWLVADRLAVVDANRAAARTRLFAPGAIVCVAIGALYVLRLIPPVPLSVQFHGIYHDVRRTGGSYVLTYERPPRRVLWRRDSRPFGRRPEDRLHYFVRVFAPTGFRHRVVVRWELLGEETGDWTTSDLIPMDVTGGRAEGFRGFAVKANFRPGRWRVTAETDDGRAIARLTFQVEDDAGEAERVWETSGG